MVPPPVSATLQVTAVFEVPVTVAENCCVAPTWTLAAGGLMETVTGEGVEVTVTVACADFDGSAALTAFTWKVPVVPGAV
jgi:hypothetical protein